MVLRNSVAALVLSLLPAVGTASAQGVWGPDSGLLPEAGVIVPLGEPARVQPLPDIPAEGVMPFADAADGTNFLLLRFRAEGADAVRLHFTDFHLPEGARVFLYAVSPEGAAGKVFGPYEASGPMQSGEFWSEAAPGREVVVELQSGGETPGDLPFRVVEMERLDAAEAEALGVKPAEDPAGDGPAEIRYSIYRGMPVVHAVKNGLGILEGDILLGPVDQLEPATPERSKGGRRTAVAITNTRYRWPGGVIPYTIDPLLPSPSRVTNAIAHWNTKMSGVIQLVPRTTQANYVRFAYYSDPSLCASYVGMLGLGGQPIYVGNYCATGNMIHEIGHAVGLYHEHTREDRNNYVQINWANISSTGTHDFYQNITNADDLGPYDYGSIMHYGAYSFSVNGLPTITTIPPGIPIGQRSGLSAGDMAGVKAAYSAAVTSTTTTTTATTTTTPTVSVGGNPSDAPVGVDGVFASGTRTFTWAAGSLHTLSAETPQGTTTRYIFKSWSDGGAITHTIAAPSAGGAITHTIAAPSAGGAYTAQFAKQHKVTASADSPSRGSVKLSPVSGDAYYSDGAIVSLNAVPAPGYCFVSWQGLLGNTAGTTSLSVKKPYSVQAVFATGAATVSPLQVSVPAAGGTGVLSVSSSTNCAWTAYSWVPWIKVTVQKLGNGSGTVTYTVAANTTLTSRIGFVVAASRLVAVTQAGR